MSSTTIDVPTVISGVSQQDDSIASPSQTRSQINYRGDARDDLHVRYPFEPVTTVASADALMESFITSDGELHAFIFDGTNAPKVLNPSDGSSRSVSGSSTYVAASNPREHLSLAKFGDSLVVTNNQVVPTYTLSDGDTNAQPLVHCTTPVERVVYTLRHNGEDLALISNNYDDGISLATGLMAANNGMYAALISDEGSNGTIWRVEDSGTVLAEYIVDSSTDTGEAVVYNLVQLLNQRTSDSPESRVYGRICEWRDDPNGVYGGDIATQVYSGDERGITGQRFILARSGGDSTGVIVSVNGNPLTALGTSLVGGFIRYPGKQPSVPITQSGDYLLFPEGSTVAVADGDTGALDLTANSVNSRDELPTRANHNKLVSIDLDNVEDPLYYKFEADNPDLPISAGKWVATTSTGGTYALTASTMPHWLTYNKATKAWTLTTPPWEEGQVAQKVPPFLANAEPIQTVTNWRGRLCLFNSRLCAGRATDDIFNIWRKSSETLYPDDPIYITPTAGIGIITNTVQLGTDLLLQGQSGWARVLGTESFSPTEAPYITGISAGLPVPSVDAQESSTWATYLSYGTSGVAISLLAPDGSISVVNEHCPAFLQKQPTWMATSKAGYRTAVGDGSTRVVIQEFAGQLSQLYEYKLPGPVTYGVWVDNHLWLIVNGVLGYIRFANDQVDEDVDGNQYEWLTRLDNRVLLSPAVGAFQAISPSRGTQTTWKSLGVTRAYSEAADSTSWTFSGTAPWSASATIKVAQIGTGTNPTVLSWDGTTLEVRGDLTSGTYWAGIPIEREWEPTIPMIKNRFTQMPIRSGFTSVDKVEFHSKGYAYDVDVTYTNRGESYRKPYQAAAFYYGADVIDEARVMESDFRVSVRTDREKCRLVVSSEATTPESFQGLTWHMKHNDKRRARR